VALSAPEVIREAIDALARADAARLEFLAQQAPQLAAPIDDCERHAAEAERRALGRLLVLTQRNLRLLGRNAEPAGRYRVGRG